MHRVAVLRVEVSGRLIGQEHQGISHQRARHGDTLLLSSGELAGKMPGAVSHADLLQGLVHLLRALRRLGAPVGEGQLDVLEDGEVPDEVE
jgi:hypothetical protein